MLIYLRENTNIQQNNNSVLYVYKQSIILWYINFIKQSF